MTEPIIRHFVMDVDGVLTSGQFLYDTKGKAYKIFGADDADALRELSPYVSIRFISADHRGFEISRRRIVEDMKFTLDLVPSAERLAWLKRLDDPSSIAYMGDGFHDHEIFQAVGYAIAPSNAFIRTKRYAHFVTSHAGGDRAVAEAVIHLGERFFGWPKS